MRIQKITLLATTTLLLSFLAVGFAQKSANHSVPWLAMEVGLSTPLTVNAGTEEHALKAFWPVPANADGESDYSAIKLEPKMVGNKLEVKLTVLSGDTAAVKSCKDWGKLREVRVTSYTLSEGEEVTVSDLSNLGSEFKNGKLTFRAIPTLAQGKSGEPCCATCGSSTCCPGAGNCLSCGCVNLCC